MSSFTHESYEAATWRTVFHRCRRYFLVVTIAVTLMGIVANSAEAAKRRKHRGNRRASAQAQAQKNRAIKSIQRQVASARKVLTAAQSQASMSKTQVSEARTKLTKIRGEIEDAHDDVQEASKSLREIEAEILAEQATDSEFKKAKAAFGDAEKAAHRVVHQLLGLSDSIEASSRGAGLNDLVKLSSEQRSKLDSDSRYQSAQRDLRLVASRLDKQRQELFEADSDWVSGQRALIEARIRSRKQTEQVRTVGIASLRDQRRLSNAQQIAAEARRVVARGEVRLRQLGAKPLPNKSSKKRSSASGKQRPAKQ